MQFYSQYVQMTGCMNISKFSPGVKDVTDLVKKQGVVMSQFEFADLIGVGIGERAFDMAEKFDLKQSFHQGSRNPR